MILLSLCGVKKINKIKTYLEHYKNINTIVSCLDNDAAGDIATNKIIEIYPGYAFLDGRNKLKTTNVKDFNELLIKVKQK